jgi:hypothetical protein
MRIFSYGGGVQSTAVLVLASQGKVQYDHFLFSNVGEDSEHPDTLEYFREIALPFAEEHGLDLREVRKYRKGEVETVRGRIMSTERATVIPMRLNSGMPGRRSCTVDFKIRAIAKWMRTQVYDRKLRNNGDFIYRVGLGISIDEIHRARSEPPREMYKGIFEELEYPLIDLRLSRSNCQQIIADAGLPVPSPSACYFCPFHTDAEWHRLRQYRPDLFFDAVEIEKRVQWKRREYWYKDKMWMHRKLIPLDRAIPDQPFLFDIDNMDNCESGYCFT